MYTIFLYSTFYISDSSVVMRRLWGKDEKENEKLTVDDFYGNGLKNFMGRHLRIGTNPWSHSVQAKALPDNKGFLRCSKRSLIYWFIITD